VAAKKKPALHWTSLHWITATDGLAFNLSKSEKGWSWWVRDYTWSFRDLGPARFRDGTRNYPTDEAAMASAERWLKQRQKQWKTTTATAATAFRRAEV
jgi:hypothetical protein